MFSSAARLLCSCGVSVSCVLSCVSASLLPASVLSGWNPKSGSALAVWDVAEGLTWQLCSYLMFLPEGHPSSPGLFGWGRVSIFSPCTWTWRMVLVSGWEPWTRLEWTVFISLDISLGVRNCWGQTLCHYRVPQFTKKKLLRNEEAERTHSGAVSDAQMFRRSIWISRRGSWKNGHRGRRDMWLGCLHSQSWPNQTKVALEICNS